MGNAAVSATFDSNTAWLRSGLEPISASFAPNLVCSPPASAVSLLGETSGEKHSCGELAQLEASRR